jgi:hypothetical protein
MDPPDNPTGGLLFQEAPIDLLDAGAISDLTSALRLLRERPRLVIFDTLASCLAMGEGDEKQFGPHGRAIAPATSDLQGVGVRGGCNPP